MGQYSGKQTVLDRRFWRKEKYVPIRNVDIKVIRRNGERQPTAILYCGKKYKFKKKTFSKKEKINYRIYYCQEEIRCSIQIREVQDSEPKLYFMTNTLYRREFSAMQDIQEVFTMTFQHGVPVLLPNQPITPPIINHSEPKHPLPLIPPPPQFVNESQQQQHNGSLPGDETELNHEENLPSDPILENDDDFDESERIFDIEGMEEMPFDGDGDVGWDGSEDDQVGEDSIYNDDLEDENQENFYTESDRESSINDNNGLENKDQEDLEQKEGNGSSDDDILQDILERDEFINLSAQSDLYFNENQSILGDDSEDEDDNNFPGKLFSNLKGNCYDDLSRFYWDNDDDDSFVFSMMENPKFSDEIFRKRRSAVQIEEEKSSNKVDLHVIEESEKSIIMKSQDRGLQEILSGERPFESFNHFHLILESMSTNEFDALEKTILEYLRKRRTIEIALCLGLLRCEVKYREKGERYESPTITFSEAIDIEPEHWMIQYFRFIYLRNTCGKKRKQEEAKNALKSLFREFEISNQEDQCWFNYALGYELFKRYEEEKMKKQPRDKIIQYLHENHRKIHRFIKEEEEEEEEEGEGEGSRSHDMSSFLEKYFPKFQWGKDVVFEIHRRLGNRKEAFQQCLDNIRMNPMRKEFWYDMGCVLNETKYAFYNEKSLFTHFEELERDCFLKEARNNRGHKYVHKVLKYLGEVHRYNYTDEKKGFLTKPELRTSELIEEIENLQNIIISPENQKGQVVKKDEKVIKTWKYVEFEDFFDITDDNSIEGWKRVNQSIDHNFGESSFFLLRWGMAIINENRDYLELASPRSKTQHDGHKFRELCELKVRNIIKAKNLFHEGIILSLKKQKSRKQPEGKENNHHNLLINTSTTTLKTKVNYGHSKFVSDEMIFYLWCEITECEILLGEAVRAYQAGMIGLKIFQETVSKRLEDGRYPPVVEEEIMACFKKIIKYVKLLKQDDDGKFQILKRRGWVTMIGDHMIRKKYIFKQKDLWMSIVRIMSPMSGCFDLVVKGLL